MDSCLPCRRRNRSANDDKSCRQRLGLCRVPWNWNSSTSTHGFEAVGDTLEARAKSYAENACEAAPAAVCDAEHE